MIVVDASVAVKWLLPEPGDAAAQELLASEERLVAPSLIRTEVAAALARRARFREIEPRDAETAMGLWLQTLRDGVIGLVAEEADLVTALELAMELSRPFDDCLYLALAERLGAPLVTADKKFVVKARVSHPLVRAL
ncbi:MAG: type II toxin-antitoxin system VapC family toxin [Bryobacteraceae bacterium]